MDQLNANEVHVYLSGLEFPVFIFSEDDRQHDMLRHLDRNFSETHYTTEELCRWSISHGMPYRIFVTERDMMNPVRKRHYRIIIRRLKD